MAPVAVGHVVSFSSQDPRFPVENLLRGDGLRPWLSCPHDQSRQLKAELQLERASAIGYIDVGNCGCAFLQIDVGRSSWPLSQPYVTLLPSVTLMTPADSKLDRNRCGVRMFKEADFLALAVGQKWDRLRLICSQPFSKHGQFGLSFIRVRTPLEADRGQPPPPSQQGLEDPESAASPWHSNPAFCKIFFPEPRVSTREEEQLKSHLQQLEPGPESRAWSPARLSRPARMVLSAAQRRARKPRASTGSVGSNQEQAAEDPGGPAASGSVQDAPAAPKRARGIPDRRQRARSPVGRPLPAPSRPSRSGGRARARSDEGRLARTGESRGESSQGETGTCPICSGRFSVELLPAHASSCGEEDFVPEADWPSSPWVDLSPDAWVSCPICELWFSPGEVERHASTCGEQAGTLGASSSPFWVE
ncbi:protein XNDC1N isoform X1 [Rhea pennata]|uniref:protein XNDC1N isoform X1 n=1 Tax=Rhea pennata TaxID=8795 RepID=UPI002E256B61